MGCGKSTLSQYWADYFGIHRLDADLEAKVLMNENSELIDQVGKNFDVVSSGKIDFGELGKVVFAEKAKLDLLNSIVHPALIDHINEKCRNSSSSILIDAALLTLWGSEVIFDRALWINTDKNTRIERVCSRNGFDTATARQRIESQMNIFSPPLSDNSKWVTIQNETDLESAKRTGVKLLQSELVS